MGFFSSIYWTQTLVIMGDQFTHYLEYHIDREYSRTRFCGSIVPTSNYLRSLSCIMFLYSAYIFLAQHKLSISLFFYKDKFYKCVPLQNSVEQMKEIMKSSMHSLSYPYKPI